ncbi:MAG: DnaD domain protein [Oscillospiraceae bacterium]|jgi:DNA replication protein DnaD|nr:DnaD domain protein [Oscillospiraceae bacterium]
MDANYISLPESIVAELLRLGDGDAALLYLYLAAQGGEGSPDEAARSFGWSASRQRAASDKLLTLITPRTRDSGGGTEAAMPREPARDVESDAPPERISLGQSESPETRRETPEAREAREETERRQFHSLVQEAQRMFGRILSPDDLIRLLGIYKNLKLPPEVILQLIRYCMTETRRRGENDGAPNMRYVEKAAYTWEREGIFSLEEAELYIKKRESQHGETELIKKALKIGGRELVAMERKYIDGWIAQGYGAAEVAIAYDRTGLNTGKLTWTYMNTIINSWYAAGLHTAAEINERDKPADRSPSRSRARGDKPAGRAPARSPDKDEMERMKRLLSGIGGAKDKDTKAAGDKS